MKSLMYCSHCNKGFIVPINNIYKVKRDGRTLVQCSYTCCRKEKEKNENNKTVCGTNEPSN